MIPLLLQLPQHLKLGLLIKFPNCSEMSDKALSHAIYLARLSDAEIIILNVLERLEKTDSSVSAILKEGEDDKLSADLEITMAGEVKQLIEEKMRLCREGREAGVKSQISYQIQTGNLPKK
jgi:nucleotide-binding universal stress UspA family protein